MLNKYIERYKEDNPKTEVTVLDFEDFAVSGKTMKRDAFQKMMELVENKKIDLIIFTKLDRLARSLQDLLNISSIFEANNVKFVAIEQNIDTSSYQGRLSFQVMGAFAEFERNIISERTKEGLMRATGVGKRGKDKQPRKRRGGLKKQWDY